MTFISNCVTLWLLLRYLLPSLKYVRNEIDWHYMLILILSFGLTYIFLMAFMKFYQRFTLESFMCLVIDDSYKVTIKAPCTLQITPSDQAANSNYIPPENPSATDFFPRSDGAEPEQQSTDANRVLNDEVSISE